jgi:hypothetical protein
MFVASEGGMTAAVILKHKQEAKAATLFGVY